MALTSGTTDHVVVTCDIPRCMDSRLMRGEAKGYWLVSLKWGPGTVTITTKCKSCHGTHSVTMPIPRSAMEPFSMGPPLMQ